jgi:hypothetical protein
MLATEFEAQREQSFLEDVAAVVADAVVRSFERASADASAEGVVQGCAKSLLHILEKRFGAVAPCWRKRIHAAKVVTLKRWIARAFVAPDLPSVFEPPRRRGEGRLGGRRRSTLRLGRSTASSEPRPEQNQYEGEPSAQPQPLVEHQHAEDRRDDRVDVGDDRGA